VDVNSQEVTVTNPPPQQPAPQYPPGRVPAKSAQRWPWIVGIVAAFFLGTCLGIGVGAGWSQQPETLTDTPDVESSKGLRPPPTTSAPEPTFSPSTSPTARRITMPNLVGENASVAADKLRTLGFTKIKYGSADEGDAVVLLPQNWTVKTQSPKAGEQVSTSDLVVLTCTKK